MPSRIQRELAFLLTGRDVSASRAMDNLNRKITGTQRHAGKAFRNIGANMERGIILGAGAAAGAIGYSITKAIDWESAFAGVRKTVEGTPAQLQEIADGLRAMSRELPVSAVELAAIAENAGALGIARGDILEFTRTVAMLAATTDVSSEMASTALGQLQNVLGLTGNEFDNFAAALVDLGNKGASTESQILEIARRAGGSAALIGLAKDETLGWAAAAANLGMNEELAGTSLQRFFQTTLAVTADGGKQLEKLATTAGMTADGFKKAFGKDSTKALSAFVKGLGKLPKEQRLKVVQSVFGKGTGLTRLIIGLADSFERNLNPSLETSATAWKESEAAQAEYEKRVQTTEAQLAIFKNNVDDAAITIGSNLLPTLVELSKEGVAWLEDHQPEIKQFGEDLATGVRDAVDYLKSLDWAAIGDALGAGADAAKALVDAFMGLPPEVKQLLVGGFVANKLTGGVGTDILGGAASGLFKGMVFKSLGVQAGVVNVTGGKVNSAGGTSVAQQGTNWLGVAAATAGGVAAAEVAKQVGDALTTAVSEALGFTTGQSRDLGQMQDMGRQMAFGPFETLRRLPEILDEISRWVKGEQDPTRQRNVGTPVRQRTPAGTVANDPTGFLNSSAAKALQQVSGDTLAEQIATRNAVAAVGVTQSETLGVTRDMGGRTQVGLATAARASQAAGVLGAAASSIGASRVVSAIAANRPIVTVTVVNNVTATNVTQAQTTSTRYGQGSSRNQDRRNP